jgi:hypothetical protein
LIVACLALPAVLSLVYLAGAISAPFLLYPAAVCLAAAVLIFIVYFSVLSHSAASIAVIATALVIAAGTMVLSVTLALDFKFRPANISSSPPASRTTAPGLSLPRPDHGEPARITSPANGATGIPDENVLPVSGTVRDIPHGHRLVLFVAQEPYTQVYVGDFDIPVKNGHWTADIYPPAGTAELLLADLTPAGYKSLNGPFPDKLGLLKSLLISGAASILNRIIINSS